MPWKLSSPTWHGQLSAWAPTVGLEAGRLTVPAACLVDGLHQEDVASATLQPVHRVVVLLDVGDDHPAVHGVVETCSAGEGQRFIPREGQNTKLLCC